MAFSVKHSAVCLFSFTFGHSCGHVLLSIIGNLNYCTCLGCCIYKKPRTMGESSTSESDSDDDTNPYERTKKKKHQHKHSHDGMLIFFQHVMSFKLWFDPLQYRECYSTNKRFRLINFINLNKYLFCL